MIWVRSPGVRLRPVPEQRMCLAYRPRPPALHGLNLSSWLVMELCDGRDDVALSAAYDGAVAPGSGAGDAPGALDYALRQLSELGLIERKEDTPRRNSRLCCARTARRCPGHTRSRRRCGPKVS